MRTNKSLLVTWSDWYTYINTQQNNDSPSTFKDTIAPYRMRKLTQMSALSNDDLLVANRTNKEHNNQPRLAYRGLASSDDTPISVHPTLTPIFFRAVQYIPPTIQLLTIQFQ
ncbi:hypothetical protein ACTXT7_008020 [Hymenolepis weldensis]